MRIQVTFNVEEECADSNDEFGLTEDAYMELLTALEDSVGAEDIHIQKV